MRNRFHVVVIVLFQIMAEQCTRRYSLMCLKLDAIKLVDRLGHSPGYQLLPGVSLVHVNDDADQQRLPQQVIASLVEGNVTSLDTFLVRRIQNFVDSLTLSVKVLDSGTVVRAKDLGENILYGSSTAVAEGTLSFFCRLGIQFLLVLF